MTPPYEPRDIAAEYRENVARLQSKIPDLPTLVVTAEQGWGQRLFDAHTKQLLPESGPCDSYTVRYAHYYDTKGKAEAVADYLITLPIMAEALAAEVDRLKDQLTATLKEKNDQIRELTHAVEELHKVMNAGILLQTAHARWERAVQDTKSILGRQLGAVAQAQLEDEFEQVEEGDTDYGRGYQRGPTAKPKYGVIPQQEGPPVDEATYRQQRLDARKVSESD